MVFGAVFAAFVVAVFCAANVLACFQARPAWLYSRGIRGSVRSLAGYEILNLFQLAGVFVLIVFNVGRRKIGDGLIPSNAGGLIKPRLSLMLFVALQGHSGGS